MSEIVPRGYTPIKKKTAKALKDLEQAAVVERKKLIERVTTERTVMDAEEANAAYRAERRIDNGYQLAKRTSLHANQLNRQVTQSTQGNPGHELLQRGLEETVLFGAQALILGYMTR
jgi:hypothetical protein